MHSGRMLAAPGAESAPAHSQSAAATNSHSLLAEAAEDEIGRWECAIALVVVEASPGPAVRRLGRAEAVGGRLAAGHLQHAATQAGAIGSAAAAVAHVHRAWTAALWSQHSKERDSATSRLTSRWARRARARGAGFGEKDR